MFWNDKKLLLKNTALIDENKKLEKERDSLDIDIRRLNDRADLHPVIENPRDARALFGCLRLVAAYLRRIGRAERSWLGSLGKLCLGPEPTDRETLVTELLAIVDDILR